MRFLAAGVLMSIVLIPSACAHNPHGQKLAAEEVTIENWKVFEAQLRRDLPIGTCFQQIEAYLQTLGFVEGQLGLGYSYIPMESTLEGWIHTIDRSLLVFTTNLRIRFKLTEGSKCLTRFNTELWSIGP